MKLKHLQLRSFICMVDLSLYCSSAPPNHFRTWLIFDLESDDNKFSFFLQSDMLRAVENTRPSVNESDLQRFEKFTKDFGMEG